jgi:hypothetical protein
VHFAKWVNRVVQNSRTLAPGDQDELVLHVIECIGRAILNLVAQRTLFTFLTGPQVTLDCHHYGPCWSLDSRHSDLFLFYSHGGRFADSRRGEAVEALPLLMFPAMCCGVGAHTFGAYSLAVICTAHDTTARVVLTGECHITVLLEIGDRILL